MEVREVEVKVGNKGGGVRGGGVRGGGVMFVMLCATDLF